MAFPQQTSASYDHNGAAFTTLSRFFSFSSNQLTAWIDFESGHAMLLLWRMRLTSIVVYILSEAFVSFVLFCTRTMGFIRSSVV